MKRLSSDSEWAASVVAGIPRPWAARLLSRWEKRRASFDPLVTAGEGVARRKANEDLRAAAANLRPLSDALPLDASDNDVCSHAWEMAERCRVKLLSIEAEQEHAPTESFIEAIHAAGVHAAPAVVDVFEQRCRLGRICEAGGIAAPDASRYEDRPAVLRMVSATWWRGQLRKAHARAVESAAIRLGIVSKDRQCYVSSWSLEARRYQNERNAAALENTLAKNLETEQEFTLAQLAAKGTANKAIRRAELMTRINGFERIAIAAGHAGLFLTITCPSKMHRRKVQGKHTVDNGKWDGTMPDGAQAYLRDVWARIRAALARRGVNLYGFRIAEPQHDGTPHWHCLFFYEPQHADLVRAIVRRYALAMDGNEPGAQEKRCDFRRMDPAKGTAAGYIAKYVAKNIDGYRLEKDLEGNDSLETSARVEAWASRWRIRQFQQIGGPPVTVWRELRRVESVPSDAPGFVVQAHNAVNRTAILEGRDNASVAWDHYVNAQGGVACGRGYRVRLATVAGDKVGRYGEPGAAQVVGVQYFEVHKVRDALGNWTDILPRTVTVESRRYTWEIKRRGRSTFGSVRGASSILSYAPGAASRGAAVANPSVQGIDLMLTGEKYDAWAAQFPGAAFEWTFVGPRKRPQVAPWTCVNNCTGAVDGNGSAGGEKRGGEASRHVREAYPARKSGGGEANRSGSTAGSSSRSDLTH